jgi:hypothetical protein
MRTLVIAHMVTAVVVAIDIGIACTARERAAVQQRMPNQVRNAQEDREIGQITAGLVGVLAAIWAVSLWLSVNRTPCFRFVASWGATMATVCGLLSLTSLGLLNWTTAKDGEPPGRDSWEAFWLIGAFMGGVAGTALGSGIAVARYFGRKKPRTA